MALARAPSVPAEMAAGFELGAAVGRGTWFTAAASCGHRRWSRSRPRHAAYASCYQLHDPHHPSASETEPPLPLSSPSSARLQGVTHTELQTCRGPSATTPGARAASPPLAASPPSAGCQDCVASASAADASTSDVPAAALSSSILTEYAPNCALSCCATAGSISPCISISAEPCNVSVYSLRASVMRPSASAATAAEATCASEPNRCCCCDYRYC